MSWDTAIPAGSDAISSGDDRIRELKTDLQTALRGNASDGVEGKFPGSDAANPIYRYRGLKDTTAARPASGQYGLYFDTTRNAMQRDNGSAWEDVGTLIPSGTVMVFYQAAAPTGWTQVALDNFFLRVTSGAGGGTVAGSSPSSGLSISAHSHSFSVSSASVPSGQGGHGGGFGAGNPEDFAYGSGLGGHTHGVSGSTSSDGASSSLIFSYANVILCSKD